MQNTDTAASTTDLGASADALTCPAAIAQLECIRHLLRIGSAYDAPVGGRLTPIASFAPQLLEDGNGERAFDLYFDAGDNTLRVLPIQQERAPEECVPGSTLVLLPLHGVNTHCATGATAEAWFRNWVSALEQTLSQPDVVEALHEEFLVRLKCLRAGHG
ncbi:hypothetical protein BX589_10146 [Paraburkholderia fungorum]|jgi:hypothetical protein|uniref:hypothetical protein n=1 Tax=Paraburkholderia fungorum TaxID=134537 RepID=UPI000D0532B2|nr:hypothetical protein [Paraburkholderia fungorum]PRZ56396.1 hypothetical protein BX589_10146 [Paraburkholderia fungorum]